jgi:hypothetical protein
VVVNTTNNNDTCDISGDASPAATVMLPYFEVDLASAAGVGQTTLFTITNTSRFPQIAHVTVWTDFSYPVLDFNIFLSGYDVQSINLYDVLVRGIVAPPSGTSSTTTTSPAFPPSNAGVPGANPAANTANPEFAASIGCSVLPGTLPTGLVADVRTALTTGAYPTGGCAAGTIGGTHANAIGYVTIDVANNCSQTLPTTSSYYTGEILFDNVLIGDYQQINPNATTGNYAGGNPMVHIRAIPEGGAAGSAPGTNLPFTFYDRYTPAGNRTADRRQPLPNTFAARWIQGGPTGFSTNYKIWREGITGPTLTCSAYAVNGRLAVTDIVRFDEHENATGLGAGIVCSPCGPATLTLPETSSTSTSSSSYPPLSSSGDPAGWMYLSLSNNATSISATGTVTQATAYTSQRAGFGSVGGAAPPAAGSRTTSQNWVIISMFAEGRYSVDFDAVWLGNGCTPAPAAGAQIAPATQRTTGALVCPPPLVPGVAGQCGAGTQVPLATP